MSNKLGRIPVTPIDFDSIDVAGAGEIAIDFKSGNIYAKDKDGKGVIDFTKSIRDNLKDIDAGNINVNVDGSDKPLPEVINNIEQQSKSNPSIISAGMDVYIPKGFTYDLHSIIPKNGFIQLTGFDNAEYGDIPIKDKNGDLFWIKVPEQFLNEEPTDGMSAKVYQIDNDNGYIYLLASKHQRTTNILIKSSVVLPKTIDEYSKIIWRLETNDNIDFTFPSNISWEYDSGYSPTANSTQVYEFETWDYGNTWYGVAKRHNSQTVVSQDYIQQNYYSKEDMDSKLSWYVIDESKNN